jgi:hypothetical protein
MAVCIAQHRIPEPKAQMRGYINIRIIASVTSESLLPLSKSRLKSMLLPFWLFVPQLSQLISQNLSD